MTWTLRTATVGVLVGVYQFNTNDIGGFFPAVPTPCELLRTESHTRSDRVDRQGLDCIDTRHSELRVLEGLESFLCLQVAQNYYNHGLLKSNPEHFPKQILIMCCNGVSKL